MVIMDYGPPPNAASRNDKCMCEAQTKKDQLSLVPCAIAALGPVPTIPGGWGLRNPKPKEPDQRSILFSQSRRAGGWQKWGGIMILANDPVTAGTRWIRRIQSCPRCLIGHDLFGVACTAKATCNTTALSPEHVWKTGARCSRPMREFGQSAALVPL